MKCWTSSGRWNIVKFTFVWSFAWNPDSGWRLIADWLCWTGAKGRRNRKAHLLPLRLDGMSLSVVLFLFWGWRWNGGRANNQRNTAATRIFLTLTSFGRGWASGCPWSSKNEKILGPAEGQTVVYREKINACPLGISNWKRIKTNRNQLF